VLSQKVRGHFMTVSQTPNSSSERKLTARLKIASKLYKASVATNPDRASAVRYGGGRVVARNRPQDKSGGNYYNNLPFHDAPSLVPAEAIRH
jgi:hypothetical protein